MEAAELSLSQCLSYGEGWEGSELFASSLSQTCREGVCVVRIDDATRSVGEDEHTAASVIVAALHKAAESFFYATPEPVKELASMPPPRASPDTVGHLGYSTIQRLSQPAITESSPEQTTIGGIESFTVRMPAAGSPFPWPLMPPEFPSQVEAGFATLQQIATSILVAVLKHLRVTDISSVRRQYCCVEGTDSGASYSDSILFLRHHIDGSPPSASAHTDSGLLTLIPVTEKLRNLQVLPPSTGASGDAFNGFVDLKLPSCAGPAEHGRYALVMLGEDLPLLLSMMPRGGDGSDMGCTPLPAACVHRVWAPPDGPLRYPIELVGTRITTPFQLRRSDASRQAQLDDWRKRCPEAQTGSVRGDDIDVRGGRSRLQMKMLVFH
jgi:hypothetical protein